MDPYWLFFKTVVHTVFSLLSAAVVLFTSGTPADPKPAARPAYLRAGVTAVALGLSSAPAQTIAPIASRLHDNNPAERAKAACEARTLGGEARPLLADLISMLADDATVPGDVCGDWGRSFVDSEVQPTTPGEKAAAALVALGTVAYAPLAEALGAPRWCARRNAAWALGAMDDRRAVGPLQAVLKDPEPPVRRKAAWALGAIDSDGAVPSLVEALKDSDAETRSNAAWALGAIDNADAVPALIAALRDADRQVRAQAAWALGAIDDDRAVPELARTMREDADAKVRSQAAWALGAIGDARATPALTAALKDADVKVRRNAAWALGAVRH